MANLSNVTLGDYRIGQEFGDGGMAEIYYAENAKTKEKAVLKTIRLHLHERKDVADRFQHEVNTASKLKHDNIIPIYYSGNLPDGRPFVIMPYIGGGSLGDWIKQERFDGSKKATKYIISIISQIASALDYAHKHDVIHRDIKPDNILLTEKGFAVLTDFGIAKAMQEPSQLTNPSVIPGTPAYMAPEQIKGNISYASDIYALGVVLFELLIGQNPFKGETNAIFYQKTTKPLPSLALFNPNLPNIKNLDRIIKKATNRDPAKRYQSAMQMAFALQKALQIIDEVSTGTATRKNLTPLFIIGSVVIVVLFAGLYFAFQDKFGEPPTPSTATTTIVQIATSSTTLPPTPSIPSKDQPTVIPSRPLVLSFPQDGATFSEGDTIALKWVWEDLENEQYYRLGVQGSDGKVTYTNLDTSSYTLPTLSSDDYSWIVLTMTKDGQVIARSVANHFSIITAKTTPTATQTKSPTMTPIRLDTPKLISPPNGESYYALSRPVSFSWSSANRPLESNEYYVLIITHKAGEDFTWLKNNNYTIGRDKEWLRDPGFGSNLTWRVVIAQEEKSNPNGPPPENPYGKEISGYSEVFNWIWKE